MRMRAAVRPYFKGHEWMHVILNGAGRGGGPDVYCQYVNGSTSPIP